MLLSEVHIGYLYHMGSDSKPQSLGAESDTAHQVWGSHSPLRPGMHPTPCSTPFPQL